MRAVSMVVHGVGVVVDEVPADQVVLEGIAIIRDPVGPATLGDRLENIAAVNAAVAVEVLELQPVDAERPAAAGAEGGLVAVREFVQHAHLGQRQLAAQVRVQHADALGVEAVEAAQGLDLRGRDGGVHA